MAGGARVEDPEAIRQFRAALVKFIEGGSAALTDAESEITKRMSWLEGEQTTYWTNNIRKCQEAVMKWKEAIRSKKLFKDASGKFGSAFDEEKKLKQALAMLAHAEERLANTRRWAKQLQKEHLMYRGGVTRLQTMFSSQLPSGVHMLENVLVQIDQYLNSGTPALAASEAGGLTPSADGVGDGAMKRSADEALPNAVTTQDAGSAQAEALQAETLADAEPAAAEAERTQQPEHA